MKPMTKHITVAVVGAGMAGQAHMFGYRNATMHPDLAGIDVRLAAVVDFNEDLARSAAVANRCASAADRPSGFSASTCLPASSSRGMTSA